MPSIPAQYPTLTARIAQDGITATAAYVGHSRDEHDGWPHDSWTVTLTRPGAEPLTLPFRMGTGHHGTAPDAEMVLSSLLSDAASVENAGGSFEEWAREYGLDTDSRTSERSYLATVVQTTELRTFLGDLFSAYVWETREA